MELVNKAATEYVWPGRITQVIDPHYFWMQLGTRENLSQFEQLQIDLQKFSRHSWVPTTSIEELEPGMVVLVDTNTDDKTRWKRGQVAGIMHGNAVDVFYVDYGNTELTTVDKICMNMPTQFKVCPPQAVRCSLAGVKPLVKKWTSRGIKTFQHLTGTGFLNVLVLYGEPGYCEVALYSSEEKNGRSVGHSLVLEEVAMMMDEQMLPEFLQDIPGFMTQGYLDTPQSVDSSSPSRAAEQRTEVDTKIQSTPPSTEKYIPPHQKNLGSPPGSAGSSLTSHGTSLQNSPNDSGQKYSNSKSNSYATQFSSSKMKEPVNDFFPFENVSVYPSSPSSPVKSPGRAVGYDQSDQGQSGSYFSRSPKYEQYGTNTGYREGYNDRYSVTSNEGFNRHPYPGRHQSRFAANFDNLPQPANTFEPGYLNHHKDRDIDNGEAFNSFSSPEKGMSGLHRSPNKSFSNSDTSRSPRSRPRLNIPGSISSQPPFYPPDQKGESSGGYAAPKTWNFTAAQVFEQSHPPYGLNPPAFYQTNVPPPPLNQSDQHFNHCGQSMSPVKQHVNSGIVSSSPIKIQHHNDLDERHKTQHVNNSYQDSYYKLENRHSQDLGYNAGSRSNAYASQYYDQNNSSIQHAGKAPVKIQTQTTPNKYHGYEPPKMSPDSPESPAIAAFNLGELEHTQMTSADHFHQQLYQERLQALQEEAEDIARESKEQSELVNYSRYGSRGQPVEVEEYQPVLDHLDVFDQIAQEIQNTSVHSSQEREELKKSPVKNTGKPKESESAVKLEGIPQSYLTDIDFTEAVREALEFGRTDMDNTKSLLQDIVELLRTVEAEKQIYDVLLLMLAKAVKEYNLFHMVVMETINTLNGEMEIKDCLAKALKRQQELCVRVPAPRKPQHLDLARVMAHIYNMALEWNDSNANIQDGILVTVEKWIVFNSKGTQIGQVDKENVFLDCFCAFWEVSGTKVVQHNQAFRSRIREEIRKKLLNEGVSRSIRERLIDITLDLFSHNVEKNDASTQTQRRTMIPSSCQVRPSTCDKATFMESEWQDEGFTNLSPSKLEMIWQVNTDYASPDPVLNLRPMGRGQGPLQKVSTPHDSFCSSRANDPLETPNLQDLSRNSEFTESVYVTPNESFATNIGKDDTKFHDVINGINEMSPNLKVNEESTKKNNSQCFGSSSTQGDPLFSGTTTKTSDKESNVELEDQNLNQKSKTGKSVAEQKSAMGKSLVDWFDYEPSVVENNRNCAKLEEKRLETRKKLDSTSMEIIENDVALKYAPTKDLSKKKSKKEKDKKVGKNTNNSFLDERKHESNKVVEEGAFEHDLKQAIIESLQTGNEDIVSNAEVVSRNVEKKVEKDIDWWGVGEAADTRYFADNFREHLEDNIYIDNGPDVIIEDEFVQGGDDFENCQIQSNDEIRSESLGATNIERQLNIQSEFTDKEDKCLSSSFEENEIGRHDLLVRQTPDEFAFDVDDDDENWDSASSEDLNVNDWIGLQPDNETLEVDSTKTESKTVIPPTINAAFVEPVVEPVADQNYENTFPKTSLGDFVEKRGETEIEERSPTTRWVPGRRKCLNCHSEDHTTENCQDSLILQ